jgi:hypothetical protein
MALTVVCHDAIFECNIPGALIAPQQSFLLPQCGFCTLDEGRNWSHGDLMAEHLFPFSLRRSSMQAP